MTADRYKLVSLTGYETERETPRVAMTDWYIMDRFYGYRVVAKFRLRADKQRGYLGGGGHAARRYLARLCARS
jgi:hypothetical protein